MQNKVDYTKNLKYHYKPSKGWINDPNGLVYFKGYYHIFYQHAPDYEIPWKQPMHWGHARTKDFLEWEELPIALYPHNEYENNGCWSGTAIVKDDVLYLFYASVCGKECVQTISVAYSYDGINFEKYKGNPIINHIPKEGGPNFRDPAVCCLDGQYACIVASGNIKDKAARLLHYKSKNLMDWEYEGILYEWKECGYAECPSIIKSGDMIWLSASVCPLKQRHYFSIMLGRFEGGAFRLEKECELDKGPDQYAGQMFCDNLDRKIMISWIPGWEYSKYANRNIGCMSLPREIQIIDGKICGYPIKELQHLLKEEDSCLKRTKDGFVVERTNREPLIYKGHIDDLKILRDEYIAEIFINGGQEVYSVLL